MALTISDVLQDIPPLLGLVQKLETGIQALPPAPAPRTAKMYADLVVSVLPDLANLIDLVESQAKSQKIAGP